MTRLRNERGSTIVEAAIVTPLMLLLTFSIADFGSMFYVYLAPENGVEPESGGGRTGAYNYTGASNDTQERGTGAGAFRAHHGGSGG